ncbi:MAG: hypothetical protein ACK4I0_09280 [Brevundimonas sp.]|uniref:hypothetical protein n=1 Tax=Brevundimonas sp. TaxID=1871086 RepID=UPI00391963F9
MKRVIPFIIAVYGSVRAQFYHDNGQFQKSLSVSLVAKSRMTKIGIPIKFMPYRVTLFRVISAYRLDNIIHFKEAVADIYQQKNQIKKYNNNSDFLFICSFIRSASEQMNFRHPDEIDEGFLRLFETSDQAVLSEVRNYIRSTMAH